MSSSFEKSVKGATKIKAAPPKTKYIEHILIATHSGEAGVAEVFRALQNRLRDSTWTVVFKSLITVHFMIREGSQDVTLAYLARHRNMLAISAFSDVQTQGRNIRHYSNYLTERARAYKDTKCDFVRGAEGRLEKLTVEKGLLRETEAVQHQLTALLKCDVLDNEPENEITITVFRLLVLDLLALFHVLNQGMINLLGHFFEMSKPDAERALEIYRAFAKQTDYVVAYLGVARQYEHLTRVEVPKLKHAPVNLGKQLQDYVSDPDFEINRRQYIAEQDVKKGRKFPSSAKTETEPPKTAPASTQAAATASTAPVGKGPDADLIDFFDSIEQNQQPMATQVPNLPSLSSPPFVAAPFNTAQVPAQYQPTGFVQGPVDMQNQAQFPQPGLSGMFPGAQQQMQPQQQQPIPQQQPQPQPQPQQLQPAYTGAGFGGYTPQPAFQPSSLAPIPQDSAMSFQPTGLQPFNNMTTGQTTNPFRQSMLVQPTGVSSTPAFASSPIVSPPASRQGTNPFARTVSPPQPTIMENPEPFPQVQQQQQPMSMQPMQTGTNPFARNMNTQRPATSAGLIPQPTGITNPFRQSTFVNTNTGMGWQHNQQPIGGGLDQLETVSVFPRPAQQQAWQQ